MALVFQYGSNMSTVRLNSPDRLQGDARFAGIAHTEDFYELEFDIWSKNNHCAAASIISGTGRKIWGVLYEIPDCLIKRKTAKPRKSLDAIEGEGSNYHRETITVRYLEGAPVREPVLTYIGFNHRQGIKTSAEYVKHIFAGLREHSIPDEYVEYVKMRVIANNSELKSALNSITCI